MAQIYLAKISNKNSGFTNQIFSLITSLLIAEQKNIPFVIVDSFQRDFNDETQCIPCSQLFDLNKINLFLKKYNLNIICKSQFKYILNSVFYGAGETVVDITHKVPDILTGENLNSIQGDPYPNVAKELYVNYSINDIEYSHIYYENYKEPLIFNPTKYKYTFGWINYIDKEKFEDILKNIKYLNRIDQICFLPVFVNESINVIHLRTENDALEHWSRQNKMSKDKFKIILENKYIETIKLHINPKHKTIIVGDKKNKVIDYLESNDYDYIYYEINLDGREMNAIYDLLQASECNETFISNFNYKDLNGSSFSYYISMISNPKKIISIDLDHIKNHFNEYKKMI